MAGKMAHNTVRIDSQKSPADIHFSASFNVAVPFIDRHLNEGRGAKIAFTVHGGGSCTYAQLAENVNRAGNALLSLGLKPQDRVLMIVKDSCEFLYTFWGAIKAGIVPVPLNTLLRAKDYAFNIENSEAAGVVYSSEFAAEVESALKLANLKPKVVLRAVGDGDTLEARMTSSPATLAPAPAKPDDDCFWLYSSGSTGNPKGAVHAHRDMVVTSQRYGVETIGLTENDVCFSAAKLFFAYGLGNAMTFPLWVGGSAVLFPGAPNPAAPAAGCGGVKAMRTCSSMKGTVFASVLAAATALASLPVLAQTVRPEPQRVAQPASLPGARLRSSAPAAWRPRWRWRRPVPYRASWDGRHRPSGTPARRPTPAAGHGHGWATCASSGRRPAPGAPRGESP